MHVIWCFNDGSHQLRLAWTSNTTSLREVVVTPLNLDSKRLRFYRADGE